MTNKEVLENIKKQLSGNKEIDVPFLQQELRKYQSQNNFDIAYGIQLLLFNYLTDEQKAKLNDGAVNMLKDHKNKFEEAKQLINYGEVDKAQRILIELFSLYEKVGLIEGSNFYDFPEPIELFLYSPNLKGVKIKKVPEPVIYYAYQIASIYLEKNDVEKAIDYLEKALIFNPICQYVIQELVDRLMMINKNDIAYSYIVKGLQYSYTKQQLAFYYKKLGLYFKAKSRNDIAVASFAVSNLYSDDLDNKVKIKEIIDKVGPILFKTSDELINLFKQENLNYGPSRYVISVLKEYLETAKATNNTKLITYISKVGYDLTDDDYFKEEVNLEK